MSDATEVIRTRIWEEIPETDNPFVAAECYCAGYDVYGDLLGKARWVEYLYLLFKQERPTREQSETLEGLAIALANPGPRDPSIHAAMSAGVGGSTHASCLMAALAVGAGQLGGGREVALAMDCWRECGMSMDTWKARIQNPPREERADIWPPMEHPPGFDPHGASCPTPVRQSLAFLAQWNPGGALAWLQKHRSDLELAADCPLAMTGVAAATLVDLGFHPAQGEMLYLLLRLPGAAVHALEQEGFGWRQFPFFTSGLKLKGNSGSTATEKQR
jgi:citrate synthase